MADQQQPAAPADTKKQQQQSGAAALARQDETRITGAYHDAALVDQRLRAASARGHLVSPATVCGALPPGCAVALSVVQVDEAHETYDVGGGKLGLGKSALDRISAGAGISWDAHQSRRLDDGSDPHYCAWQAVGTYRRFDGTECQVIGNKEMDLRPGSPQVIALEERAKKKNRSADQQVREMRMHIVGHAETKARLRAIRSLGIRSSYEPAELRKPFVVARLMWTGQSDDPELRRAFALKQADAMLGGVKALYGGEAMRAELVRRDGGDQLPFEGQQEREPGEDDDIPFGRDDDGELAT